MGRVHGNPSRHTGPRSIRPLGRHRAPSPITRPSRGRKGYTRLRVLQTKPGRADVPRVLSVSCSDKIACWSVLGIQGAVASLILAPVYIYAIVLGEVDNSMREQVLIDCDRVFYARLSLVT